MEVSRVSVDVVHDALDLANQDLDGNLIFRSPPEVLNTAGTRHKVRLSVASLEGPGCRRGVPHLYDPSGAGPRRIRSACWHAFGAYMAAIFEQVPEARIKTAVATYKGVHHFFAAFNETGDKNIGSMMLPYEFRWACNCEEHFGTEEWATEKLIWEPLEAYLSGPDYRLTGHVPKGEVKHDAR